MWSGLLRMWEKVREAQPYLWNGEWYTWTPLYSCFRASDEDFEIYSLCILHQDWTWHFPKLDHVYIKYTTQAWFSPCLHCYRPRVTPQRSKSCLRERRFRPNTNHYRKVCFYFETRNPSVWMKLQLIYRAVEPAYSSWRWQWGTTFCTVFSLSSPKILHDALRRLKKDKAMAQKKLDTKLDKQETKITEERKGIEKKRVMRVKDYGME